MNTAAIILSFMDKFGDFNNPFGSGRDAVITLPNSQTITLENVHTSDLNESLFVKGPITLSWSANGGDTVIQNFNLAHDLIDFNYAFAFESCIHYPIKIHGIKS